MDCRQKSTEVNGNRAGQIFGVQSYRGYNVACSNLYKRFRSIGTLFTWLMLVVWEGIMSDNIESTVANEANVEVEVEAATEANSETEEATIEESVAEESVAEAPVAEKAVAEESDAASDEAVDDAPEAAELVAEVAVNDEAIAEEAEIIAGESNEAAVEAPVAEESAPEAAAVEEGETADAQAADSAADADADDDESEEKRVVRRLAVGQEVDGVVKRITEFGAFVDIGVGRDGLVHISELDVRRVGKVSDVVQEGQSITAWIKKLDRQRNRISLTMIPPGTKTIRDLQKDDVVSGTVTRLVPYGAFVDIGVGRDALLHVREMAEGFVAKPDDVVSEGEELEVRIIEVSRRRGRIDLSLKGLRPEPEAAEPIVEDEIEEEIEDPFANVEVLSPMELAFRKAMSEDAEDDIEGTTKKRTKRARREELRALQDEIVSRTLDTDRGN
jgi:predicted RNA-binding protein with RPS1 domain